MRQECGSICGEWGGFQVRFMRSLPRQGEGKSAGCSLSVWRCGVSTSLPGTGNFFHVLLPYARKPRRIVCGSYAYSQFCLCGGSVIPCLFARTATFGVTQERVSRSAQVTVSMCLPRRYGLRRECYLYAAAESVRCHGGTEREAKCSVFYRRF